MKNLFFYLQKLHNFAGIKLYFNYIGMVAISMFEGIGILLIVPVLSAVGLSSLNTASVPFIGSLMKPVQALPDQWLLPVVLGIYVFLILLQGVLQRSQTVLNMEIQQGFMKYLRLNIYQSLLQAHWVFFLKKRKSDFNHVLTQELGRVGQGAFQFLRLSTTIVFTVIQVGLAFLLSVKLTAFILVSGTLVILYSRRFAQSAKKLGSQTSELSQNYIGAITDHFNGIKDIKTNNLELHHLNWFRALCDRMERNYNQFTKLQSNSQLFYKAASAILIALFIVLSIRIFHTPVEQLALISLIFSRLWPRLAGLQSNWEQLVNTIPAFRSLIELEEECEAAKEQDLSRLDSARKPFRMEEGLECRQVSYRYDRRNPSYALQDISLYIPVNQMTAIVGKSGAGKSTLIDILIGLIQPERGAVLVDGQPLTAETVRSLRSSVSYVAQDPFLFHSTIRENLMLVKPDATEEELWEALRFSASEEFVRRLPSGLDTVIGDRGVRLSGGERQRVVLARAILRKPSILVLDEATSALDNENEAIIQYALERLKGSMTIIVIAHRLSTIRNADQVLVLENGRIIQQGGFTQLTNETKGTFNKLLDYQRRIPLPSD